MKQVLLLLMVLGFAGQLCWGQKKIKGDVTAAYIAPTAWSSKNDFQITSGAFVFDATKRMGVSNIYKKEDGTYLFKYLGEEQPDAIYETLKGFFANASAKLTGTGYFNAEVASSVESMVEKLTLKSNALTFLRTSLYRINEAAFNEDIQEETYEKLILAAIQAAKEIQLKELGNEIPEQTDKKQNKQ